MQDRGSRRRILIGCAAAHHHRTRVRASRSAKKPYVDAVAGIAIDAGIPPPSKRRRRPFRAHVLSRRAMLNH